MKLIGIASVAVVLGACGGQLPLDRDAGADAGGDSEPGEWTTCSSPGGHRVCYGPNHCFVDKKVCEFCLNGSTFDVTDVVTLGWCAPDPGKATEACSSAADGKVCFQPFPALDFFDVTGDPELGLLLLRNGGGDRVRYADYGLFDGTPLPEPVTCPVLNSARICGGNCGGCAPGEVCHGRSPLHPYGFCVSRTALICDAAKPTCSTGTGCFVFKVQPAAQPLADTDGLCLPAAVCLDLAANLPGGGACSGV